MQVYSRRSSSVCQPHGFLKASRDFAAASLLLCSIPTGALAAILKNTVNATLACWRLLDELTCSHPLPRFVLHVAGSLAYVSYSKVQEKTPTLHRQFPSITA